MADREEVIKGLEKAWDAFNHMEHELYADYVYDALELLKEQEPVHIQKRELAHMWFWCCGSCGVAITEGDRFCRMCGKAVKWDD